MKKQLIFITLLSLFVFGNVKAQSWGGGSDESKISYGFSFQVNTSELKILKTLNWQDPYFDPITESFANNYLKSITPLITQGIGIGGIVNVRLTKNLDLHFTPMFVFNDRKLLFTYNDGTEIEKATNITLTELPLSLKLKSERFGNFRLYMLGGLKSSFDISSRKNVDPLVTDLAFKRSFLSYEAGLGLDIYFEWFKVSPEIKLSHSFKDVLQHQSNPFSAPIEKAKLRSFAFTLIFQ